MSHPRLALGAAGLAAAAALAVACAHDPETLTPAEVLPGEFAGAPAWVTSGCTAYWGDADERGTRLCAVGSLGGTRNISLARSGAVGRGRTELARALQSRVEAMLKDYQASTTGGEAFARAAADEQHAVDVARQITDASLPGAQMEDTWLSHGGTLYALVALDLDHFEEAVQRMGQLDEHVRRAVIDRAEAAFRDLDEQVERERHPAATPEPGPGAVAEPGPAPAPEPAPAPGPQVEPQPDANPPW